MAGIEEAMETLHLDPDGVEEKPDIHIVTEPVVFESETFDVGKVFSGLSDVFGFDEETENKGNTNVPVVSNVVSDEKVSEVVCVDNGESVTNNSSEANVEKQGFLGKKMKSRKEFLPGDFVWGKVKTHPWWPGRIYDPKDASPFAITHSQENRLLVAYFGDGSCSWSLPSQVVPFVENFKRLSSDKSSSKSLQNAIQCAVTDISMLVDRSLTCKCVPSDIRDGLSMPLAANAGVKDGVLVPDVDIRRMSIPEFSSHGVLEIVKGYAKGVSVESLLEFSVFKSWVSSFYRAKGGRFGLAMYSEPFHIQGLEDKSKTVSVKMGEDDWLSSSQAAVKISDDKTYHRKKKKSISVLMGEGKDLEKVKSLKRAKGVKDENGVTKSASYAKRRKSEKGAGSSNGKTSRKRMSLRHLMGKSNEIKVDVLEKSSDEDNEELETVSSPRERKKSKYLSPPYTNPGWSMVSPRSGKSLTKTEHSTSSDEDLPIVQLIKGDQSQTSESHKLSFDASVVDVKVDDLLSDVQFAAVDYLHFSKKGSLETVWAFISALRNSTYSNGADYKTYQKSKSGNDAKTPKSATKKKTEGKKPNLKKSKNSGDVSTCLVLTVNPGFPIPSKEEILDIFGKFGNLNSEETNVMTESRSVQIVYKKESDAEKAFKSSVAESPFGAENVNYWLQHSKSKQVKDPEILKERDEFMSSVFVIRQKLEMMSGVLESQCSKLSAEGKSSLMKEMEEMKKNVEKVSEMVQATAEK